MESNEQKTAAKIHEIAAEAEKAGKTGALCQIGATAAIIFDNHERKHPVGDEMVPCFFVTKIHNGKVIREEFI